MHLTEAPDGVDDRKAGDADVDVRRDARELGEEGVRLDEDECGLVEDRKHLRRRIADPEGDDRRRARKVRIVHFEADLVPSTHCADARKVNGFPAIVFEIDKEIMKAANHFTPDFWSLEVLGNDAWLLLEGDWVVGIRPEEFLQIMEMAIAALARFAPGKNCELVIGIPFKIENALCLMAAPPDFEICIQTLFGSRSGVGNIVKTGAFVSVEGRDRAIIAMCSFDEIFAARFVVGLGTSA
jgi:hypothetical protein